MNKQIEEMAKALLDSKVVIDGLDRAFARIHGVENSRFEKMARYLVETQGYRKSTDVARNIFGNLRILGHINFDGNFCIRKDSFEALEKQYESEGE